MAAVAILAVICTTVIVVLDRCMRETMDNELKMQAFEAARESMEKLLGGTSVSEMVAFGVLEENPEIDWQMVVEPFREPVTSRMWIRAVCTASYKDSTGKRQELELRHWITDLSSKQVKLILNQQERERAYIEETGENPFGNDSFGLLRWAHHLAETGDFAAAADVAEQIQTDYPESEEAQQAENIQERWQAEAKRKRNNIEETGENPFGNDSFGLLRWAHHLAGTGDFAAAAEVAEQIKTDYPESGEAQQVENVQERWQEEVKKESKKLDEIDKPDEPDELDKTNKPDESDNRPEWQKQLEAGEITFAEAMRILFQEFN